MIKEPCSPEIPPAPWEGLVARVPHLIRADTPADLDALQVPCFLTVGRMVQGVDEEAIFIQFVDPRDGRVHELPIESPGDFFRPVSPFPDQELHRSPPIHQTIWRSMELTDSHHFHLGVNRFRFRVANLFSTGLTVAVEMTPRPLS